MPAWLAAFLLHGLLLLAGLSLAIATLGMLLLGTMLLIALG